MVYVQLKYSNDKKINNWEEKEQKLISKLNKFRKNDGNYDCIVSGSGSEIIWSLIF